MSGILEQALADYKLRAIDPLPIPEIAASVGQGSGTATYEYVATFVSLVGETSPTQPAVVTNAPNTLSPTAYIKIDVKSVPAAAKGIRIYRKFNGVFCLLKEVASDVTTIYDNGSSLNTNIAIAPDASNTSGRPEWVAVLWNAGRFVQRAEFIDMEWLLLRSVKALGDITHRNGDVIDGCVPVKMATNRWKMSTGRIYLDGQIVQVPEGVVDITGSGTENVGLTITPRVVSEDQDVYLRDVDQGCDIEYAREGAHRLVLSLQWDVNREGQLNIQEFVDGIPTARTLPPERTVLMETLARRSYLTTGDCSLIPPQYTIEANEDPAKFTFKVLPLDVLVRGYEVQTMETVPVPLAKGRDTVTYDNITVGFWSAPGGVAIASNTGPYNVDGLYVSLKVGEGYIHTIQLTGASATADSVATQINAAVNARKTSGQPDIVTAGSMNGKLTIAAQAGKKLSILTCSSNAYSALGLTVGDYLPSGTRIYRFLDSFIKRAWDIKYISEQVLQLSYSTVVNGAVLPNNVASLIGASVASADCHDGYFDFRYGVDFSLSQYSNQRAIIFDQSQNKPSGTFYLKCLMTRTAIVGQRVYTTANNVAITRSSTSNIDYLPHYDVVKVTKIMASSNGPEAFTKYKFVKNSDGLQYSLSYIDWTGVPAGERPSNGQTYYVSYEYWNHTVEGDVVTPDSYSDYEKIEIAPDGVTLLRDCLDFRVFSNYVPKNGEDITCDYERYVGRIDKVGVNTNGEIKVIPGPPSINPTPPFDMDGVLSVFNVAVSPYTYSVSEIRASVACPQNKKQIDIAHIVDRIEKLEYWQAQSSLEYDTTASDHAIGTKGLFADPIVGYNKIDTSFDKNGVAHNAAIDLREQAVKLPASSQVVDALVPDWQSSSDFILRGNMIMKAYEPELYSSGRFASRAVNCNPDNVWNPILGRLTLTPAFDLFQDSTQLPQLNIDYDNNLTNVLNIMDADRIGEIMSWSDWKPTGNTREDTRMIGHGWLTTFLQEEQQRLGDTFAGYLPSTTYLDLGNRVVNTSLVHYCRTMDSSGNPFYITVDAAQLMPNADHGCLINGIPVDLEPIAPYTQGTHTLNGKTTVKTDNSGVLKGRFKMPEGVPVGAPLVSVVHYLGESYSSATAQFHAGGLYVQQQETVVGLTTPRINTNQISETRWIDKDIVARRYVDPIAQTFPIDEDNVYIQEVGVYFAQKSNNTPITCEIRNVSNGYVTDDVIMSTTLYPSDIVTSDDATKETRFRFSDVVALKRGWYGIAFVTNCVDYSVWVAKLGETDVTTGLPITAQSHDGVFFHSPNGVTWVPETTMDMKINIYKANFRNEATLVINNITGVNASHLMLAVEEYMGPGVNATWYYSPDGGQTRLPIQPWLNTELGSITANVQLELTVSGSNAGYAVPNDGKGLILMLYKPEANYIIPQVDLTDQAALPNQVVMLLDCQTDGFNGAGVRSITPYYSVDDGETWCELKLDESYTPVAKDRNLYEYRFVAGKSVVPITGATNATPIVLTCANHGFTNGERVLVQGVQGNTAANNTTSNPYWVVTVIDKDHVSLNGSQGSGSYSSGGTIELARFSQIRGRVKLTTNNQALSPIIKRPRLLANERV
jgi:hypothetical protein